jgi:hypothetical protein
MPPKKKFRLSQKKKHQPEKRQPVEDKTDTSENADNLNRNPSINNDPKVTRTNNFTIKNRDEEKSSSTNPVKKLAVNALKKITTMGAEFGNNSKSKTVENIPTSSTSVERSTLNATKTKASQAQRDTRFVLQHSSSKSSEGDFSSNDCVNLQRRIKEKNVLPSSDSESVHRSVLHTSPKKSFKENMRLAHFSSESSKIQCNLNKKGKGIGKKRKGTASAKKSFKENMRLAHFSSDSSETRVNVNKKGKCLKKSHARNSPTIQNISNIINDWNSSTEFSGDEPSAQPNAHSSKHNDINLHNEMVIPTLRNLIFTYPCDLLEQKKKIKT